jgi:hypothetical protein
MKTMFCAANADRLAAALTGEERVRLRVLARGELEDDYTIPASILVAFELAERHLAEARARWTLAITPLGRSVAAVLEASR